MRQPWEARVKVISRPGGFSRRNRKGIEAGRYRCRESNPWEMVSKVKKRRGRWHTLR